MATSNEGSNGSDTEQKLNELYWRSELTVGDIANEVGVSRSALYSAVRPLPVGSSCPDCGERLEYTNRTSRAAGMATCSGCGLELDDGSVAHRAASAQRPSAAAAGSRGEHRQRWKQAVSDFDLDVDRDRMLKIGLVAALGVAAGVAAVYAARQS